MIDEIVGSYREMYDALVLHGVEAPIHLESLKGRLSVVPMVNHREMLSDGEVYYLDNKPIARFYRIETSVGDSMLRCSRPYLIYPA